ncbi:MAG: MFS transporter [Chloroflexi bacterium]|nr:MFS transporter [Chloroflexota bacterium]
MTATPDGKAAPAALAGPPAGTAPRPPQALSHREILVVIGAVMTGMLLAALDQSIVGTALPRIVSELGGLDKLAWVVTAYLLTSTAVTPLWGKISDLYGRRLIFQVAISVFLAGSALSGLSQNMAELIAFRALQGVGGGGLFSIALAIIGDVIPPRERGRYQGYFGAVFGASSIAGPLLGGWLTDGPGWRWIFYINLPIGIAALVITSVVLKLPVTRRDHTIDYLGAAAIVAGVSALLLYLDWAGNHYGWTSPQGLGLVGTFLLLAVLFVVVELRSPEPIIPLRLFRNSIFSVGNGYAFLGGMAMFGSAIFLPVYLQAVKGMSPTQSGLALVPMVVGIAGMSMTAGRLITRTGKYKVFPILGAAILIVGLLLLSHVHVDTPYWQIALFAFIAGGGLGFTMQTVVVAIQNSVEFRDMGTATSSVTFFRQTGAAIGTAVYGAVLTNRLNQYLGELTGTSGARPGTPRINAGNVQAIQRLPEPLKAHVLSAFARAIDDVFLVGVPFVAVALVVAFFLKEIPLRTGVAPALATRGGGTQETTASGETVTASNAPGQPGRGLDGRPGSTRASPPFRRRG